MRLLPLVLILLACPSAEALPPGAPGSATPQPYGQPQIRPQPVAPPGSPPLLVNPGQPSRVPNAAPRPLPQDQPLPSLETQRRSQQRHPAESIDKP
ncbi:MAG: hypothetical protein LPK18_10335 [Pseudomonadaceae bacterium]|nr:hypothetical protein [Pseudomonadaceae bacterium]